MILLSLILTFLAILFSLGTVYLCELGVVSVISAGGVLIYKSDRGVPTDASNQGPSVIIFLQKGGH